MLPLLAPPPASPPSASPPSAALSERNASRAWEYSRRNGGQTMVVRAMGRTIFERYGPEVDPGRPLWIASGAKSFVGVAGAAAVQDGLIRWDASASESLPEWRRDPRKRRITYRHLMAMSSGLGAEADVRIFTHPSWRATLETDAEYEPGARFAYNSSHHNAFACAIERRLKGESFEAYLKRRVFDPLKIRVEWRVRTLGGEPHAAGGSFVTARDWATFGEFVRLGGRGVVRPENLRTLIEPSRTNPAYGLGWWLNRPVPPALRAQDPVFRDVAAILDAAWLPKDLHIAVGAGKNRLYILPSLKAVVVRQGTMRSHRGFDDAVFLSLLLRGRARAD